jgi:cellulose synthase/poly-beta-1,6-N-acetylglucosamine synthase-like glycosyltransferase
VLIPVKNALPWLPIAVRDCLKQTGVRTEVIVVNDGSIDGSAEWLQSLVEAMGDRGSVVAQGISTEDPKRTKFATASNPAFTMPMRLTTDAAMSKAGVVVADGITGTSVSALEHDAFISASDVSVRRVHFRCFASQICHIGVMFAQRFISGCHCSISRGD